MSEIALLKLKLAEAEALAASRLEVIRELLEKSDLPPRDDRYFNYDASGKVIGPKGSTGPTSPIGPTGAGHTVTLAAYGWEPGGYFYICKTCFKETIRSSAGGSKGSWNCRECAVKIAAQYGDIIT